MYNEVDVSYLSFQLWNSALLDKTQTMMFSAYGWMSPTIRTLGIVVGNVLYPCK